MVNLIGNPDGSSAVDYTVNCAVGFPFVTGPDRGGAAVNPVNHVMPVWDALAGINLALALVAAERHRRLTGADKQCAWRWPISLSPWPAISAYIAEVQVSGTDRRACGNDLFGAYGAPFETRDGRIIYIAVVTDRMWNELVTATGLTAKFEALEAVLELDLRHREGDRFQAREAISSLIRPWCLARTLIEIQAAFDGTGVCWGPIKRFARWCRRTRAARRPIPCSPNSTSPASAATRFRDRRSALGHCRAMCSRRAPILGEHTDEILSHDLGLSETEINRLRDSKVVAGPLEVSRHRRTLISTCPPQRIGHATRKNHRRQHL